jgi:hypothetical protein
MLNQPYFYHGCVKNIITIFGAMFSDIYIKRQTGDGYEYQEIKVPISYAPKQRALVRIAQNPNIDNRQAQITLPRMAFEIVSMNYDSARKININSIRRTMTDDQPNNNFAYQMNSPTPYNIHINLYLYAKNQDDALQMVEQIFPFFNPDLNITINAIPEMNVVEDIPIILDSVSYEDDYEGDLETRRAIIWTLSFTAKMNFYGPITTSGLIKKVNIAVSRDEDSNPFLRHNTAVDPLDATINDTFNIVETFLYDGGT